MVKKNILIGLFLLAINTHNLYAQEQKKDSLSRYYELQEIQILGKQNPNLKIDAEQLKNHNKNNVLAAVNLLPGVSITQFGARNEGSIMVRGFNSLRTPVFYDGIPIYTPYDGNFDLSRLTTFDVAHISVEKSLISVKYGPNAMGAAVNIVSRKPEKAWSIDGQSGLGFAAGAGVNSHLTALNIGTRKEKYYAMVSGSYLKVNNTVLSKKFEGTAIQPAGKRMHSGAMDFKLNAKFGYTPNETDEYAFSIITQKANKNVAPNALNSGNNNWRDYPAYDKTILYVKTKTLIAPKTYVNFTGYYDSYSNKMVQYDDDTYTLLNKNPAFSSVYNDYSLGAIVNLSTEAVENNVLTLSINNKYDSHKENNEAIAANSLTGQIARAGEPIQQYLDNTFFVGIEDVITLNSYLKAIVGASFNYRNNIQAQEYGTHYVTREKDVLYDFPQGVDQAFNYKAGLIAEPFSNHFITLSAAKRSRFASQKERYSFRFGKQVPNPALKSEFTWAYDLSYAGSVGNNFNFEVSGFVNTLSDAIFGKSVGKQENDDDIKQNVNLSKALFRGYELGFGYSPLKNLTFGANYSYIDMKDKTKGSNQKFVDVPKHKLVAYGKVEIPVLRAAVHANVEHYGKRYRTNTGDTAPKFTLVNAKVSFMLVKEVHVDLSVRNLFDSNYYLAYGYPKEGRSFMSALSYRF